LNKIILGLILYVSILVAQSSYKYRYELITEYKLVNACIDERTSGGVTKVLRNSCIKRVEYLEKKYYERDIKSLDEKGKLKELFSN